MHRHSNKVFHFHLHFHLLSFRPGNLSLGFPTVFAVVSCGTTTADQEEVVIHCVAIFYEEGKGGENFRKNNKLRCKVSNSEKRLAKYIGRNRLALKSHSNYKSIMKMNSKANPKASWRTSKYSIT